MAEDADGQARPAIGGAVERRLRPVAKLVLKVLALPAAGIAAAGVLFVVGLSLLLVAVVFLGALVAGAVAVPLALLAGRRRRRAVRSQAQFSGQVMDAEATVRVLDKSPDEDEGA